METTDRHALRVRHYCAADRQLWDAFVRSSRNGVFLFERGYMDYHADRYADASLIVEDDGEWTALLPAHHNGDAWMSHGGLTFGGLVMHPRSGASDVLAAFDALLPALRERGARTLSYKPVPHLYHRQPSEDDVYALHRLGARTTRVELSTTIDLARRPPLAKGRRHALSKARRAGIEVRRSDDYAAFWALLERVLDERHGVAPTHTDAEMQRLADTCGRIELHGAYARDELLAGAVVYRYDGVAHTQYLAASPAGREVGALDAVVASLIGRACDEGDRWFNFGTSTSEQGRHLNASLAAQKEMFGGRSTVLQTLELALR